MQVLFSLAVAFCSIAFSSAAVYFGHYGDPAYPGKCVLNGIILAPGEVHHDVRKCEKISCDKHIKSLYESCGLFRPPTECKLGDRKHPLAPYPGCCDHHIICNHI